jgi:hypothetical protein
MCTDMLISTLPGKAAKSVIQQEMIHPQVRNSSLRIFTTSPYVYIHTYVISGNFKVFLIAKWKWFGKTGK